MGMLVAALLAAQSGALAGTVTVVPRLASQAPLFPAPGESRELMPGGPRILNKGKVVEVHYPGGRGKLVARYDDQQRLALTVEYDGKGRMVEEITWGSPQTTTTYEPESGKEIRWVKVEPTSAAGTGERKLMRTEERLEAKTGKRVLYSKRELDPLQKCLDHATPPEGALAQAVDSIICAGETRGATCDSGRADALIPLRTGVESGYSLRPIGPLCVDNACEIANPDGSSPAVPMDSRIQQLIQETIYEGAQCLARMSGESEASAARTVNRIGTETRGSWANSLSTGNPAMRNSAMLLMMYNQSPGFGNAWSADQQHGAEWTTPAGDPSAIPTVERRSFTRAQARERFGAAGGPISVTCGNAALGRATAAAILPGEPGWPGLILRRPVSSLWFEAGPARDEAKQTLFHEMMHMIGYPHDEDLVAFPPMHAACAVACFPGANRRGGDRCDATRLAATQALDQRMCSGQATDDDRARYKGSNCACYTTGDPAGSRPGERCPTHY